MAKQMMLINSVWNEKPTFKMMPITNDCPYVECIYDPDSSVFVVISKQKKTTLHMLPKLDDYGQRITGNRGAKQDRHKMEVFQEYYIDNIDDIENIVTMFAENNKSFDYKKYFTKKPEASVTVS